MPQVPPSSSINFDRPFSLPFGVPPDSVEGADLARYEAELGVECEFLELAWNASDPFISHEHPRDPFTGRLRVRFLRNASGTSAVTVPTPLNPAGIAAGDIETIAFSISPATLATVAKSTWSAVTPSSGEPMSAAIARTFRWDDHERKLWALPQPYFADETLCLYWPPAGGISGPLGTDIPGIFASDTSTYLLGTKAAARNGELQSDLLRAPVRGLAKFTRYRHVGITVSGTTISAPFVHAPSGAGAITLRAPPPSPAAATDPGAPLFRDSYLVFEHVDIAEASSCFASLWWLQLLRFTELEAIPQLVKDVRTSTAWAFAVYLALAMIRPPPTDALGGLPVATRERLRFVRTLNSAHLVALRTAIAYVLADTSRRSAFADFLRTILGPLVCGMSWAELGFPGIPAEPGTRTNADRAAHALLEEAQQAGKIWVAVYAGAPIGRPALRYGASGSGTTVSSLVRNGWTTFDLEALVLSGHAASVFSNVIPPTLPPFPDQPLPLRAYAGEASGRFAALRLADSDPGSIAFTTRDWLRHLVFGWQRIRQAQAPLDFSLMAVAGHPLTQALFWSRRLRARSLRASLDQVNAAEETGVRFDQASVAWWSNAVGFATGTNWPLAQPGGRPGVQNAMREARNAPATLIGKTVSGTLTPSGFDEEDLELALEAREHLRSGHDKNQPVDIALILALLDREGYRMRGPYMRQGPFDKVTRENMNGLQRGHFLDHSDPPPRRGLSRKGASQGIGRFFYALQVFGLDVLDWRWIPTNSPAATMSWFASKDHWLRFAWENLVKMITNAAMEGTVTGIDTMGLNGRTLLRVTSQFDSPASAVGKSRLLSRYAHLGGIIAQHGEFQRRHALLRRGAKAGPLDRWWQPSGNGTVLPDVLQFTSDLAPTIGANAEDTARRDYLAYYALCYLAFNGSPSVWKSWVDRAVALGAANIPRFLLYEITDAQSEGGGRELWHRGHFVRFVVALDAYLRMSDTGVGDVAFPVRAGWGV